MVYQLGRDEEAEEWTRRSEQAASPDDTVSRRSGARPAQRLVGRHALAAQAASLSRGVDVIVASNYGEAGALELFGRNLPPVASPQVTFRYWRPPDAGRSALLIGFGRRDASFCTGYRQVGRIAMPVDNEERGQPIARCRLAADLGTLWPRLVESAR